ncbi:MAG TPA: ankyrin repeat domain-containing protein [Gemmatimonadaceae bacterium]|nr:ankyrin repeat domain-containing protein [Gemmatimonadaceae bacterium]
MPVRRLPVVPNLDQLKHQARDLLRAMHSGDSAAIAELREFHPDGIAPSDTKLADAQLILARSYQATSWPRLVQAVELVDAIWKDDIDAVRALVTKNPSLIQEQTLLRADSNWGPPMSYAANAGRDRIIQLLHDLGARDHRTAFGRAVLQSKVGTAKLIRSLAGLPSMPDDGLGGPAYTLSVEGTAYVLSLGARMYDDDGTLLAPFETVVSTDARNPEAKHAILELYVRHGLRLPDTAPMALHRGRLDLLEAHLRRDPGLLSRTFSHDEIYPRALGCMDPIDATTGTPLDGTTLLHMCVEYDELEIARWLLDRGMDPDVRARVGASGFGGFTALFNTVVSQPNFWMNYRKRGPFVAPCTELLLSRGANPNPRASIWKRLHPGHGDTARHEYHDVTPLSYGQRFHAPIFVSQPAMQLIRAAGGKE